MKSAYLNFSIGRKFLMALSALFLLLFLLQHFTINFLSVLDADLFNEASEFMGTNPLVQYLLQPVLFIGVIFHFVMGFVLEVKNRSSRGVGYAMTKPGANSSFFSRYMLFSGITILLFLCLHLVDFFFPTIEAHYITHEELDSYKMVRDRFRSPLYVGIYVISFVFLSFHLLHGFQSAFQSVGLRHPRYFNTVSRIGKLYAIGIPLGFIFIAVFHFLNQS